jgi:hypothetical protein
MFERRKGDTGPIDVAVMKELSELIRRAEFGQLNAEYDLCFLLGIIDPNYDSRREYALLEFSIYDNPAKVEKTPRMERFKTEESAKYHTVMIMRKLMGLGAMVADVLDAEPLLVKEGIEGYLGIIRLKLSRPSQQRECILEEVENLRFRYDDKIRKARIISSST